MSHQSYSTISSESVGDDDKLLDGLLIAEQRMPHALHVAMNIWKFNSLAKFKGNISLIQTHCPLQFPRFRACTRALVRIPWSHICIPDRTPNQLHHTWSYWQEGTRLWKELKKIIVIMWKWNVFSGSATNSPARPLPIAHLVFSADKYHQIVAVSPLVG